MPAINIGTLFIEREDQEGDDSSGIVTEDDDNTKLEAGGYARDFLEVVLRRLWEGRFGRRRTTTGADPSRTKRSRTVQRRRQRNGGCVSDNNAYNRLP
jgi:hypothetical protein